MRVIKGEDFCVVVIDTVGFKKPPLGLHLDCAAHEIDLLLVPQHVKERMIDGEVRMHRHAAQHHDHAWV